jgi:methyl acetate hydrolase
MTELDAVLARAVAGGDLPYAVGAVARGHGVVWSGAAGDSSDGHTAGPETLFALWSMTKAIGGLAAMILVDRGQLSLETEVREVLPQFGKLQVLESMGPEGPVLRPARRPATLRHLLTHTSGLAYDAFDEKMYAFQNATGIPQAATGSYQALNYPLMFDPGDGWAYGIGVDWAGYMVQQVDGRAVDQFCREEIFRPLGMTNTTFEADDVPARRAQVYKRAAGGSWERTEYGVPAHPEFYGLGHALWSTAPDYIQFLRLLLTDGELDGYRFVSADAMKLIRENQMLEGNVPVLEPYIQTSRRVDYLFDKTPMTHTAASMRTERDIPGMRAAGSLWWAGFLNTFYWVDPANDVTAVLMTQTLPFCDSGFMRTWETFEHSVYSQIGTDRQAVTGSEGCRAARGR